MRKLLRALVFGLMLAGAVAMPVTMSGCSAQSGIFQSDPVGASLKTVKDTYEASVKTAGRLYVIGSINLAQITRFRNEANKFHKAYTELATIHEIAGVKEGDLRLANVLALGEVLVNMVAAFTAEVK